MHSSGVARKARDDESRHPPRLSENQNANPKTMYYYLNRSTDGDRTWSLNGTTTGWLAAVAQSTQPNPKFRTVNALLGGVDHIAVDSNSGDVYIVFGNRDSKTGQQPA